MHTFSPDLLRVAGPVSRRGFLQSCSVLALCLTGCQGVGPRTRFAAHMVADPPEREYRPVLRGLIEAILAFEHPSFPALTPADVENRLVELFPIHRTAEFGALQRGLLFFDDLTLFPHLFSPLVAAETADGPEAEDGVAGLPRLRAEERDRYARFRASVAGRPGRFTELTLPEQRSYVALWSDSALAAKRQFVRSAKSLVMITAYSTEELWAAIGYQGPIEEAERAQG